MRLPLSAILLAAGLAAAAAAPAAPASPSPAPPPALAVEDTMHTEVPPVFVRAPRVTLGEILDRVAAGEARRDSLIRDQSYQLTVRAVGHSADSGRAKLVEEIVSRVYQRRPDQTRVVQLRHWQAKPPKNGGPHGQVNVTVGEGMEEDVVNFAFKPAARRKFDYRILGRQVLGDHVIYQLGFEPRSVLDVFEPSGVVWVDTRDYVIVRQEITFRQSPVPLLLRGIDRLVVERRQADGFWVLSRVLARIRTTIPFPQVGTSIDLAIQFDDYALNSGLPDSLFGAPAGAVRMGDAR